jgi:hypothetical protein
MLNVTGMATVRMYEVVSDSCEVVAVYIHANYA